MTSTIKIKNSSTAGAVPGSGDLVQGELAVNVTDKKIYTKNASGTVVNLGTTPSITDNGNAEAIVIDSSENVGIGVSPTAWSGGSKVLTLFAAGNNLACAANDVILSTNANYVSGTGWIYGSSNPASYYEQYNGTHAWFRAASGTAGNSISFTQAMTLDASGNLGVGGTSPASRLDITGTDNTGTTLASRVYSANRTAYLGFGFSTISASSNSSGLFLEALGANVMSFSTNGSERARIDSSGNLLVGCTSTTVTTDGCRLTASNVVQTSRTNADTLSVNRNGTDGACTVWYKAGTQVGSVSVTGSATAYNTSSDYRLKENITPMTGALAKVAALKPCTYTWKANGSAGEGFIAHELAEVVPEAVAGEKDAVNEDGSIKPQGIDTSFLVATLTAAIQEQQAIIESLTARITALEA